MPAVVAAPADHSATALPDSAVVIAAEADAVLAHAKDGSAAVTVINVWATWCGPCREEFPALLAAIQRHQPGARLLSGDNHQRAWVREPVQRGEMGGICDVWSKESAPLGQRRGSNRVGSLKGLRWPLPRPRGIECRHGGIARLVGLLQLERGQAKGGWLCHALVPQLPRVRGNDGVEWGRWR